MTPQASLTWWGHATTTIRIGGVTVLTDPVLTRRLGHLSRIGGPAPARQARDADLVLLSHLHSDHFHLPSLRRVGPSVRTVGPGGSGTLLPRATRLTEAEPGDVIDHGPVTIRAVPAAHDGRRHNRSQVTGHALGYVIEYDGFRIWFAGDTALFDGMTEVAPVDVAVVPIGGWGPTLGEDQHLDPAGAVEAARRTRASYVVPMHFGTFWPTGLRYVHPWSFRRLFEQPAARFVDAIAGDDAEGRVLDAGETTHWP